MAFFLPYLPALSFPKQPVAVFGRHCVSLASPRSQDPEVLSKFIILWVHPMEKAELGEWDINTAKVGGLFLSRWLSNEDLLSCDRGTLEKKVLQERKEARWVPTAPCLSSQSLYGSPKQGGGWGMG